MKDNLNKKFYQTLIMYFIPPREIKYANWKTIFPVRKKVQKKEEKKSQIMSGSRLYYHSIIV